MFVDEQYITPNKSYFREDTVANVFSDTTHESEYFPKILERIFNALLITTEKAL